MTTPDLSAEISIDGCTLGRPSRPLRPLKHRQVMGAAWPTSTATSRPVSKSHTFTRRHSNAHGTKSSQTHMSTGEGHMLHAVARLLTLTM